MGDKNDLGIHRLILSIIRFSFGSLSALSSLIYIIFYLAKKDLRKDFKNLLCFCLGISCFFQSICFLCLYDVFGFNNWICEIQALVVLVSFVLSFIIVILISVVQYNSFRQIDFLERKNGINKKIIMTFIFLSFIIYLTLYFFFGLQGEGEPGKTGFCWANEKINFINLGIFFVLTIVHLVHLILFHIMLKKFIVDNQLDCRIAFFTRRLLIYFFVLFFVYFSFLFDGILLVIPQSFLPKTLKTFMLIWFYYRDIVESSSGLIFTLVYCYSLETRNIIYNSCCKNSSDNVSELLPEGYDSSNINSIISEENELSFSGFK